jgi:hypothetical protein
MVYRGRCARREVICILENNGKYYINSNWCKKPQKVCPRKKGEGYDKCKKVCHQKGHAEKRKEKEI